MSKQHTAGPWETDGRVVYGAKGEPVAHCNFVVGGTAEEESNAWLIAAAPDLLAACERVLRAIKWGYTEDRMSEDEQAALLREVIAEARVMSAEPAQDIAESETCPEGYECPTCGENRTDALIWTSEEDTLICETCGTMYAVEAARPADERTGEEVGK